MEINVSQEPGRGFVTLSVNGELTGDSADVLKRRAEELVAAGTRNLVIDLAESPYLSMAGIRAIDYVFSLLTADLSRESCKAMLDGILAGTFKSPRLKLANPSPAALEGLRMAGVDMYLEIHHSLKDAVASFVPSARRQRSENAAGLAVLQHTMPTSTHQPA